MKRVLLSTPCYQGLAPQYLYGFYELIRGTVPDMEFVPVMPIGTYVQTARNMSVGLARRHGCQELLFLDSDIQGDAPAFRSIFRHDVDIVSGRYFRKQDGGPKPTWEPMPQSQPDEQGLLPCLHVPCGLLRVKMRVFDRIDELFPFRRYQHDEGGQPQMEYFPFALSEKGSFMSPAEAALDRIRTLLVQFNEKLEQDVALAGIVRVARDFWAGNSIGQIVGEDFGFSRLARAAGFTLWQDTNASVRHWGAAAFPRS